MMARDWHVFEQWLGPVPEVVHSPLGAEFIVTKERVLKRPKEFYYALNKYMKHWQGPNDIEERWRKPGT